MAEGWRRAHDGGEDLEGSLERAIATLTRDPAPHARALLNEAERLRTVVVGWRHRPPRPDEHAEMTSRVSMLATAAAPQRQASHPEIQSHYQQFDADEDMDAATGIYNPDHDVDYAAPRAQQQQARYEEPPTVQRQSPVAEAHYEPVAAVRPIVIEAEPLENSEPQRPRKAEGALAAVKDAVLVDEGTAEPLELSRKTAERPLRPDIRVRALPMSAPSDGRLTLLADPYSDRADAYRSLARKIGTGGTTRVIAVTSAEEKEGKTTCAANLALALREGARGRVLLVEANLRAPALGDLFGFKPPECFDEQLKRHRADPSQPWTVVEQISPLHVLAVDASLVHAPMMDPAAFSAGMESLKGAGYDFIVLDTPPVLGGAAVNSVADHVDGIVLAVTTLKTTRRSLKKAAEQLRPAPILGVVMLESGS